jgi:pimeloyl-ACP methyl ester carboxylesterase
MGGMIAQRMALAAPRRVEKLALISTHCGGAKALPPTPEVLALAMEPQLGRDAIRRNVLGMSAPGFDAREPEALEAFLDLVESQPTRFRVMQAQLEAIGADDRHDLLPGIEVPTLVVTGDVDPLVPGGNSETLARRIPEAKLTVIAGCGHMVMLERPHALADALRPFLEA